MHYVITRGRNIREQMSAITEIRVQSPRDPLLVIHQPCTCWVVGCQGRWWSGGKGVFWAGALHWPVWGSMLLESRVWLYKQHLLHVIPSHSSRVSLIIYEVECHWLFGYFSFASNMFIFFVPFLFFFSYRFFIYWLPYILKMFSPVCYVTFNLIKVFFPP